MSNLFFIIFNNYKVNKTGDTLYQIQAENGGR